MVLAIELFCCRQVCGKMRAMPIGNEPKNELLDLMLSEFCASFQLILETNEEKEEEEKQNKKKIIKLN